MGSAAGAEGLAGHSVTYEVKPQTEDKAIYLEGQASSSLSRTCTERSFGEIFLLAIERAKASGKAITEKSQRIEDKISAQEALDGSTLKYQTRLRQDARLETANATATLGRDGGQLHAVLSRYKQDSALPAGTLPPGAARAALVEALLAGRPDPIEVRSIEMYRFHKPIVQSFTRLPPTDASFDGAIPKALQKLPKEFLAGKTWRLRRKVSEFNEFGDELWLLHESGVILREAVQRQNIKLLLEAKEVSLFPPPACP